MSKIACIPHEGKFYTCRSIEDEGLFSTNYQILSVSDNESESLLMAAKILSESHNCLVKRLKLMFGEFVCDVYMNDDIFPTTLKIKTEPDEEGNEFYLQFYDDEGTFVPACDGMFICMEQQ